MSAPPIATIAWPATVESSIFSPSARERHGSALRVTQYLNRILGSRPDSSQCLCGFDTVLNVGLVEYLDQGRHDMACSFGPGYQLLHALRGRLANVWVLVARCLNQRRNRVFGGDGKLRQLRDRGSTYVSVSVVRRFGEPRHGLLRRVRQKTKDF